MLTGGTEAAARQVGFWWFIRHTNTKYRPARVGGDEDVLNDHVVRVEHAEIR